MPTDEQRMREAFEAAIAPRCDPRDLVLSEMNTYGTEFLEVAFMDWRVAWLARDAEVQALKDEVQNLRVSLRDGSAWAEWTTARDAEGGADE